AAEMLATVGELPNGMLAAPRLLSNLSDAPMLGEAAILWLLTTQTEKGFPVKNGGSIPTYVYILLILVFLFGTWRVLASLWNFREARRGPEPEVWAPMLQVAAWAVLLAGAAAGFGTSRLLIGFVLLVVAVMLPI